MDQMAFERFIRTEKLPYVYDVANSVATAKTMVNHEKFDVIVADYNLGDGTCFDLVDEIKGILTIITTGAGDECTAVQAMREGVFDYLIKDVERKYLQKLPVLIENGLQQKKTQETIKMLSHAMMNISDSVSILNMNYEIIFVNKSFLSIYGYAWEEIIGQKHDILDITKTSNRSRLNHAEDERLGEFYSEKRDGTVFPIFLTRSLLMDENDHPIAIVNVARDITEKKKREREQQLLIKQLQKALTEVKTLSGMLPICAACKKIRDDKGYWNQIEQYVKEHSDAEFSHSLCPECVDKLYPDLFITEEKEIL